MKSWHERGMPISYVPIRNGTRSKCDGHDVPRTSWVQLLPYCCFFVLLTHGQKQPYPPPNRILLHPCPPPSRILLHPSSRPGHLGHEAREVRRRDTLGGLVPWPRNCVGDSASAIASGGEDSEGGAVGICRWRRCAVAGSGRRRRQAATADNRRGASYEPGLSRCER